MTMAEPRISVVVLTYNRRAELLATLGRLAQAAPGVPVLVVDNASGDDSAGAVRRGFPGVQVVQAPANLGAAGRNLGGGAAGTDYVAFCDDDVCWLPGSLERACEMLDRHPDVAVLSARVLVGLSAVPDPACAPMAASPLPGEAEIGPALVGFMAGACVMRAAAFRRVGGYWPPLFIGGEEALLALDLLQDGWRILYAPALAVQHRPSVHRDAPARRRLLARNALLVAWMRLPWRQALAEGWHVLGGLPDWPARWQALREAAGHAARAGARRRPVDARVCGLLAQVRRSRGRPSQGDVHVTDHRRPF
ncbi:glycosyltransferase, partial [Bordetella hinzii]|nr:glycosyltransferase [Bordetella hinzii]